MYISIGIASLEVVSMLIIYFATRRLFMDLLTISSLLAGETWILFFYYFSGLNNSLSKSNTEILIDLFPDIKPVFVVFNIGASVILNSVTFCVS